MSELKLDFFIGFSGLVSNGHQLHPNGERVFPLGSNICLGNVFLRGHTNLVTCLAISKSGRYIASGQQTHMGFQADIIIWDYETKSKLKTLTLHKVKVEALAFSPDEKNLCSLGGEDDNSVILWDLETGKAVCGAMATNDSSGPALCLKFLNNSNLFVTGGKHSLRVWEIYLDQRKIKPVECQLGQIKRIVKCLMIDDLDEFMYCGTTSGDLLKIDVKNKLFKESGPKKAFSMGITACIMHKNQIYVGAGDGTVAQMQKMSVVKTTKVNGSVTSMFFDNDLIVSTSESNIYCLKNMEPELLQTCHYSCVNDVAFPSSSDVFATASDKDVRIWGFKQEFVRIRVNQQECKCLIFKLDGSSLITGWNDGKIRAYGPQSGRLQYEIKDAHNEVTALAVCENPFRIISGGLDGQVRIWIISNSKQTLQVALKEHKGMVTCIKIRKNNKECVSSSSDGSCIVWDLERHVRNQVLFAPSVFKAVCYYPEEFHILTTGTDRKVAYWESYDGSLIRELLIDESINTLDIWDDGQGFVIGSGNLVRVYSYELGELKHLGVGHSMEIQKIKISPDQKKIISVSMDGAVFQWSN